jgi:hypothetical protein
VEKIVESVVAHRWRRIVEDVIAADEGGKSFAPAESMKTSEAIII